MAGKGLILHAFGGACITGTDGVIAAACSQCFCCSTLSFSFGSGGRSMQRRAKGVPWQVCWCGTAQKVPSELAFPVPDQTIQRLSASACGCSVSSARLWCWESCAAMYPDRPLAFSVSCQQPVWGGAPSALCHAACVCASSGLAPGLVDVNFMCASG